MAEGSETQPHTYPAGVPCWIEYRTPESEAESASAFYGELFDWAVHDAMPPDAPGSYLIAALRGKDAAAIAPSARADSGWTTYIAVDDVEAAAARARELGGSVGEILDAGPAGRWADVVDPRGAAFTLWQAGRRLGSQVNNAPGSWNFSDLHTPDPDADLEFYRRLLGWEVDDMGPDAGAMLRVPGYGDHLEATVDPQIRVRQAGAPEGFADAIGGAVAVGAGESPQWHVTFAVSDREETAARAERLGAVVVDRRDGYWAATARLRDPRGAEFTVSQFTPPDSSGE